MVRRVEWGEVVTDLQSESKWALGVSGPWTFPKERWKHFKSASLHTVKRTIPKRAYFLLAVVVALPVLGWIAYHRLNALAHPAHYFSGDATASTAQGQGGGAGLEGGGRAQHVLTPEEWSRNQTPRLAGVPWSAPMWDGLKPTTTPDLLCAIIEREDGTRDCRCVTEQVTPVDGVDQAVCYKAATQGIYNPYRSQQRQEQERGRQAEAQDAQRPATVPGGWASRPWPGGVGAQVYTPPGEPGSWNPDALAGGSR